LNPVGSFHAESSGEASMQSLTLAESRVYGPRIEGGTPTCGVRVMVRVGLGLPLGVGDTSEDGDFEGENRDSSTREAYH